MEFDKSVSDCCLQPDSMLYYIFIACDNIHVQILSKQTVYVCKDYFSFSFCFYILLDPPLSFPQTRM